MAKRTAALRILFGADTKQFDKALSASVRKMQRTAQDLQQVGKNLSKNLSAPLLGIAGIAIKTAADFEFAMAKVQAVSGFTASEMQNLTAQAQALGASTSKTQDDVARLQLELAKLGKTAPEIEAMTESVLSLSIAFDQELGETARVVGATLNQFGLDAEDAGRVADNMAILFGNSALDLEKFDAAMRTVGPTASALGLSVEQAGAAIGILVNAGVDASTAGTALTKSFTTLAKEGFSGAEALKAITSGNLSVAQAFEIFGDRAGKIIPVLQGTTNELDNLVQKQLEGEGAAIVARKVLEATAKGGLDKLKSAASAAATQLGQKLLPAFNKVVEFATRVLTAFSELDGGTIALITSIGSMVAAIGPTVFIAGQMVFAMSQLKLALNSATIAQLRNNLAVLANPYVIAGAAVVALIAILYKLSTRTNDLTAAQQKLQDIRGDIDDQYADESSKLLVLTRQYEKSSDNLEKRKTLLERIRQIAPEVAEGLDAEKSGYDDLKKATDAYLKSLREEIALKVYKDELTTAIAEQVKLEQQSTKNADARAKAELELEAAQDAYNKAVESGNILEEIGAKIALNNASAALADGQSLYRQQQETNTALETQNQIVADLEQAYADLADSIGDSMNVNTDPNAAGGDGGETTIFETEQPKKMEKAVNSLNAALTKYNNALKEAARTQKSMADTVNEMTANIIAGKEPVRSYSTAVSDMAATTDLTIGQQLSRVFSNLAEIGIDTFQNMKQSAAEFGQVVGQGLGQAFMTAKQSNESLGEAFKRTGKEAIGSILAEVVAMAIRNAFAAAGASGPLALFLAPALAGAAAGAAKSLFTSAIPAFAQGGMVTGPTLSLLGDNKSGMEAVIPFERMGEFLGKYGGGNQNVNVHGRVDGRDLVLVQERGLRNQTRYR